MNLNKSRKIILLLFGTAIVFLIIYSFQAYRDWAYICQNTGSQRGYREWFCGIKTNEWYTKSELEKFISEKHKKILTFDWVSYAGTGKNIFGTSLLFRHGRPLNMSFGNIDHLNDYVNFLTPNETLNLYKVFMLHDEEKYRTEYKKYVNMKLEMSDADAWNGKSPCSENAENGVKP